MGRRNFTEANSKLLRSLWQGQSVLHSVKFISSLTKPAGINEEIRKSECMVLFPFGEKYHTTIKLHRN